ncbi:hypothetical protein GCM10025734_22450 [Kitasatospora paranensis]
MGTGGHRELQHGGLADRTGGQRGRKRGDRPKGVAVPQDGVHGPGEQDREGQPRAHLDAECDGEQDQACAQADRGGGQQSATGCGRHGTSGGTGVRARHDLPVLGQAVGRLHRAAAVPEPSRSGTAVSHTADRQGPAGCRSDGHGRPFGRRCVSGRGVRRPSSGRWTGS